VLEQSLKNRYSNDQYVYSQVLLLGFAFEIMKTSADYGSCVNRSQRC
jgi:hypothetical protein